MIACHAQDALYWPYSENPCNQTTPYEQEFGNSGNEKRYFNRKKPQAESGSHLLRPVGGKES